MDRYPFCQQTVNRERMWSSKCIPRLTSIRAFGLTASLHKSAHKVKETSANSGSPLNWFARLCVVMLMLTHWLLSAG